MREDDLNAFLAEHGGLEGLARELGQSDPRSVIFEPAANENVPSRRKSAWRMIVKAIARRLRRQAGG